MKKKISFLIPSSKGQDCIQKTIDSINSLNFFGNTYEIAVFSKNKIIGDNVVWFEEKHFTGGPVYGYNFLAQNTNSEYLFILNDDSLLPNNNTIKLAFDEMNKMRSENKKLLITGFSDRGYPCILTPGEGDRMGSMLKIPINIPRFPVARWPIIARETYEKYLDNHVWHPEHRYCSVDNWLGWWMGLFGEPYHEISEAYLITHTKHEPSKIARENTIIDCNTSYILFLNMFYNICSDYVHPEHSVYNRSPNPRKEWSEFK